MGETSEMSTCHVGIALALFAATALPACASSDSTGEPDLGMAGSASGIGGTPAGGGNSSVGTATTGGTTASGGSASGGGLSTGGLSASGATSTGGTYSSSGGAGGGTSTGGTTGTGGLYVSGGASGSGGEVQAPAAECITSGSQVILMGDSYINWVSHTFPTDFNTESGMTVRDYAIGGYSMGSGGIGFIPTELDTALAADPDIKVIVLDGGGNDILVPDTTQFPQGGTCKNDLNSPNIPDCQAIVQKAIDTAVSLMDRVVSLGITDVLFFFYPHVPEGTLIGGLHPNAILDYALPKVKAACDGAEAASGLRCHFVDLIPVFDGHPDYFAPTDIHPNSLGSQAMAKAIWARMQADCIGQMSGCCTP